MSKPLGRYLTESESSSVQPEVHHGRNSGISQESDKARYSNGSQEDNARGRNSGIPQESDKPRLSNGSQEDNARGRNSGIPQESDKARYSNGSLEDNARGRNSGIRQESDKPRHSNESQEDNARGSGPRVSTFEEVADMKMNPEIQRQSMSSSYRHSRRVSSTTSAGPVPMTLREEYHIQLPESTGYRYVGSGAAFTPNPISVCRFCGMAVTPVITYEPSAMAYILCLMCCLIFPFLGLILGIFILMSEGFREPRYTCPVCGAFMGVPYMIV